VSSFLILFWKLQPGAPKVLNIHIAAQGFKAISNYLLSSEKFVVANKVIFFRNLSSKYQKRKFN